MSSILLKQLSTQEFWQFPIARCFGGIDPRWDALSRSEIIDIITITQLKPENQSPSGQDLAYF